jgi:hypothetical protein
VIGIHSLYKGERQKGEREGMAEVFVCKRSVGVVRVTRAYSFTMNVRVIRVFGSFLN